MTPIHNMRKSEMSINFKSIKVWKMYRLGGETDSAIRWRKRTGVMSAWGTEKPVVKNFLKPLLKMPFFFCEFGCYNRKLCVNKPISFFSNNTDPNVKKKMTHQQLKKIKEYCSYFGRKFLTIWIIYFVIKL